MTTVCEGNAIIMLTTNGLCYESIFIILISVDLSYGDQADMVSYRRSPRNCQMPPLRRAMTAQMMLCSSRNVVTH